MLPQNRFNAINAIFQIKEDERVIRTLSGSNLPESFLSSSNSVQLEFSSDGSVTRPGFQLRYSAQGLTGMSLYIMSGVRGKFIRILFTIIIDQIA